MIRKRKLSGAERRAFVEEFALTTLALQVADAIKTSGKSQREIATELGVSEARVSQIVAITANPTVRTLARLADVLGRELRIKLDRQSHVPATWEVISGGFYDPAAAPTRVEFVEREELSAA